jgi:hypothetical protein
VPCTSATIEPPEAVASAAEVEQQQLARTLVEPELGRERSAHVLDARERGDHGRDRRDGAVRVRALAPGRLHRERVLADRHRDAEPGTELERERFDGIEQRRVLAGCETAAIQFAESLTWSSAAIGAANRLVSASPSAMRAAAFGESSASGVRSPIAMASPA